MLAFAHHVERLIDAGELSGYAEAARALGVTRARLTQIMKLLLLAPDVHEQILAGGLVGSERRLRRVVDEPIWSRQCPAPRAPDDAPKADSPEGGSSER